MRSPWRAVSMIVLLSVAAGCVGDKGVAPATRSTSQTLGRVVISPRNAIMAVGDTLTLTASTQALDGSAGGAPDSVVYSFQNVQDTLRLHLTTTGLLTAVAPSSTNNPAFVNVMVFKDGVVVADQAIIQITATRIAGVTLSIQPSPSDSAKLAWGSLKTIIPVIRNTTTGQQVTRPTVQYEYREQDSSAFQCYVPTITPPSTITEAQLELTVCGGKAFNAGKLRFNQIRALRKGTGWVYANVTVYGVPLRDSVLYTLTNPYSGLVYLSTNGLQAGGNAFFSDVAIAPGGIVTFYNGFPPDLGITLTFAFDHPEAALATSPPSSNGGSAGNVTTLTSELSSSDRLFVTPGVYHVTATVGGGVPPFTGSTTTGTITVQ